MSRPRQSLVTTVKPSLEPEDQLLCNQPKEQDPLSSSSGSDQDLEDSPDEDVPILVSEDQPISPFEVVKLDGGSDT